MKKSTKRETTFCDVCRKEAGYALLLDEIEQRASLVTPGPWKQARSAVYDKVEADGKVICFIGMSDIAWQLADFIAASRTDLPLLVKALRRAMQALEEKDALSEATRVRQNAAKLASLIAREIFKTGDEPNSSCRRIQFKGGKWPDAERNQGGLREEALAGTIQEILSEHDNVAGALPLSPKVLSEITAILEGKEQEPKDLNLPGAATKQFTRLNRIPQI